MKQAKISQLALETAAKSEWQPLPTTTDVPPSPVARQPKDNGTRRYTIVQHEQPSIPVNRFATSP